MRKEKKEMKTFIKTITVGNFYNYCIYKITDAVGRVYYVGEAITKGVTRCAETEQELKTMLEHDYKTIVKQNQRTR